MSSSGRIDDRGHGVGTIEDSSFDAVFHELFPRAFRLAHRIVGTNEDAEDIAAEALARAFADWPSVGPLPYRDAWVLRVATNLALDAVRRKRPALAVHDPVDPTEQTVNGDGNGSRCRYR